MSIPIAAPGSRRLSGGTDRRLTAIAIGLAAGFAALTMLAVLLPPSLRQGAWVPLHLLFAGAATTAIAGVMPFFTAAVAGAPPAPAVIRAAGIAGIALGALIVAAGRMISAELGRGGGLIAGLGGVVFIGGVIAVAAATLLPLRAALGPRRIVMGSIYGVALLNVILGATLSTLYLVGWPPVVVAWGTLKAAHAWFNLFGFVSLVIAGSLLHLLPTVAGARINRTRASVICFAALASGPPLAASGFVLQGDLLAMVGAGVTVLGGIALGAHCVNVVRARAKWTTDAAWHLLTTGSLVGGCAWFIVGSFIAAAAVVADGASAAGWQLGQVAGPLTIGWVAQVLIGATSHLIPAIGPGGPERHATQRRTLGRAAAARLAALNAGVVAVTLAPTIGGTAGATVFVVGVAAVVAAGASAVILIAAAVVAPERSRPGSRLTSTT